MILVCGGNDMPDKEYAVYPYAQKAPRATLVVVVHSPTAKVLEVPSVMLVIFSRPQERGWVPGGALPVYGGANLGSKTKCRGPRWLLGLMRPHSASNQ